MNTTTNTLFTVSKGACPTYDPEDATYSPFQNLESSRIRSACLTSENDQRLYFKGANIAHAIILWYYLSINNCSTFAITLEKAIDLLRRYCHRSADQARFNIENSKYALERNRQPAAYGNEISNVLRDLINAEKE